jgi:hypothetical protein
MAVALQAMDLQSTGGQDLLGGHSSISSSFVAHLPGCSPAVDQVAARNLDDVVDNSTQH